MNHFGTNVPDMSTTHNDRATPVPSTTLDAAPEDPRRVPLPPPGPAWGGAVMGLSITGALTGIHVSTVVGTVITAVAAVTFLVLLTGWRHGTVIAWSMMTMGLLSLGSAADTNLGWADVHLATCVAGSVAAVVVFAIQCPRLLRGTVPPVYPGVLPLVTPMVAATNAAQLGHPLPGAVFFVASLVTALPAFVRVYLSPERRPAPRAAATAWIPLGVVGQSSAAAVVIADGAAAGRIYATVMLCTGIPAALWALWTHWGAMLHLPDYDPAWWSATFPVGTCSLGTHLLSGASGQTWLDGVSAGLLALLCLHVLLAVGGLLVEVRHRATATYRYSTSTGE